MNYLFIALAIVSTILALHSLSTILRVVAGKARWNSEFALLAQTVYVAGFGTLAVWLSGLAFA